jgi:regulator of protease activity HflC (stomatin/prohibitin superfamily)
VDFTIDARRGVHVKQPLEKLALALSLLAQQHAGAWIAATPLREVLRVGAAEVRERIHTALGADAGVVDMGLAVTSVRVGAIAPAPEL